MKESTTLLDTPYYRAIADSGISLPAVLQLIRKDATRIERPTDGTMWRKMFLTPRPDGCANTLDTSPTSNLIMTWNTKRHTSENCASKV